jgi:ATP-dependent protease ClpP protease subunit
MKVIRAELNKSGVLKISIIGRIGAPDADSKAPCVSAADVLKEINANPNAASIEVEISSKGGSYMEGLAMYHMLKEQAKKKPVTCKAIGLVASAGTLPLLAGKVVCPKDGWVMIHNPSMEMEGNVNELKEGTQKLEDITVQMAEIYSGKTGLTVQKVRELMDAETYMTGSEAQTMKFVDEVSAERRIAAFADVNLDAHAKAPEALKAAVLADKVVADAEGAAEGHKQMAEHLKHFHSEAAAHWAAKAAMHHGRAEMYKSEGLHKTAEAHASLAKSCEARNIGHLAKADADAEAGKHKMAHAAHQMAEAEMMKHDQFHAMAKHHGLMKEYHASLGTEEQDDDGDVGKQTPAPQPKTPDAEASAKGKEPVAVVKDVRIEFKAMCDEFGHERAAKYFEKGVTMDDARKAFIQELKAELGRAKVDRTEAETRLQVALKSPSIPFDPAGGPSSKASVADASAEVTLTAIEEANVKILCAHTKGADEAAIRARILADKAKKQAR